MKRLIFTFIMILFLLLSKGEDTIIYVYNSNDPRYVLYLDSLKSYEIGYSVSKNAAESVSNMIGDNELDKYFLGAWSGKIIDSINYVAIFNRGIKIDLGRISPQYDSLSTDKKFPWSYVSKQYRRLDSINVQPYGMMQGGELPDVYVYKNPEIKVILIHKFTILDKTTYFILRDDGKTKIPYNKLYYYNFDYISIDSIDYLDPITKEKLNH